MENEEKIHLDQRFPEQIKALIAWAASRGKDKINNTYQFKIPKYEEILIKAKREKKILTKRYPYIMEL